MAMDERSQKLRFKCRLGNSSKIQGLCPAAKLTLLSQHFQSPANHARTRVKGSYIASNNIGADLCFAPFLISSPLLLP